MKLINVTLVDDTRLTVQVASAADVETFLKLLVTTGHCRNLDSDGNGFFVPLHAITSVIIQPEANHDGSQTTQ